MLRVSPNDSEWRPQEIARPSTYACLLVCLPGARQAPLTEQGRGLELQVLITWFRAGGGRGENSQNRLLRPWCSSVGFCRCLQGRVFSSLIPGSPWEWLMTVPLPPCTQFGCVVYCQAAETAEQARPKPLGYSASGALCSGEEQRTQAWGFRPSAEQCSRQVPASVPWGNLFRSPKVIKSHLSLLPPSSFLSPLPPILQTTLRWLSVERSKGGNSVGNYCWGGQTNCKNEKLSQLKHLSIED